MGSSDGNLRGARVDGVRDVRVPEFRVVDLIGRASTRWT